MKFKILIKKLQNKLTPDEEAEFNEWLGESLKHKHYFNMVKESFNKDEAYIDQTKAWKSLERKLKWSRKSNVWKYAAAAVIAVLLLSAYLFTDQIYTPVNDDESVQVVQSQIKTGTDKAVLTLEDGTEINLGNESTQAFKNATSDGRNIIYDVQEPKQLDAPEYHYLTIPRGGQFSITLSDGTRVWLNSESKLRYPVAFSKGSSRKVELIYGEAYFEVTDASTHEGASFKVMTGTQVVTVLGTQFNVQAYQGEDSILTTLVEGKVQVDKGMDSITLSPDEQAIVSAVSGTIEVASVDAYSATLWKEGIFSFNDMPIGEIMKVLARWYDVEMQFKSPELKKSSFDGVLRKNQNIESILESIKITNGIDYKIKKNTVIFE